MQTCHEGGLSKKEIVLKNNIIETTRNRTHEIKFTKIIQGIDVSALPSLTD